jgi:hypothetical protein
MYCDSQVKVSVKMSVVYPVIKAGRDDKELIQYHLPASKVCPVAVLNGRID